MPSWTRKDERQYDAVKENLLKDGRSEATAQEIAARTVNKRRRQEGRTPNQTTQGTGNPNTRLEDRTVDELRNIARDMKIGGRSKLTRKDDLIAEIRKRR